MKMSHWFMSVLQSETGCGEYNRPHLENPTEPDVV